MDRTKLEKIGKTPISESTPCGENVRYEPEFEEIQAEIDKLSSPSAIGVIDWKRIEELSSTILSEKSKDLLVAAYLSVALLKNNKEEGLVLGVQILKDLLENFWDGMFPPKKRKKGRIRSIEWWRDKIESFIKSIAPLSFEETAFNKLVNNIDTIDKILAEKLQGAPSILPLKRLLEQVSKIKEVPREEKGTEKKTAENKTVTISTETIDVKDDADLKRVLNQGINCFKKVASFLMESQPQNPLGYRVRRIASWVNIIDLPVNDGGKTKIPAPQPQIVTNLKGLKEKGDWKGLLNASESRLSQYPLWLDLNYFSFLALINMGNEYKKSADVVKSETACFVGRLPGLERFSFSNGLKFADSETKKWLEEIVVSISKKDEVSQDSIHKENKSDEGQMDFFRQAQEKASQGDLISAVSILQRALKNAPTVRDRFMVLTRLIDFLVKGGKATFAFSHCDNLLEIINKYHVDEWDPTLAFEGLLSVWHCFNSARNVERKRQAVSILSKMSAIDVARVMSVVGE